MCATYYNRNPLWPYDLLHLLDNPKLARVIMRASYNNRNPLALLNLPLFSEYLGLASLMGVDENDIKLFNRYSHKGYYYNEYSIPKSGGGERIINQPGKRLKAIQAWILRNILDKLTPSTSATAFIKGMNLLDNVMPHSRNRYFLCLDIENFFPSIKTWKVARIFSLIGYSERASRTLANLCTCKNRLPQGGVTSPSIANLVAGKLDRRLAGYTARRNIIYTRYADDMTFSSNNPRILCKVMPMLYKIVETSGFNVNERKTRMFGPRRRCLITGLVKNNIEAKFGIGRKKKRQMRAVMYNLIVKGHCDLKYTSEQSVLGWLCFLKPVDPESYEQMKGYYDNLKEKMEN